MQRRRYKVALVADWYLPRVGGLELHIHELARELNLRGHEAHIICATPGPQESDGVRSHRLDVPLMPGIQSIRSPQAMRPLEQRLRSEAYDIIHCQSLFSPLCHAGMFLAKKLGVPSVFTEHSVLQGVAFQIYKAFSPLYRWAEWPTILTAVSSYVAEDVRKLCGREVFVLPNGIDPSRWAIARPRVSASQGIRVTSVLRLNRRKRPLDILRAIPRIDVQLPPELRPRFTLAGDGPERSNVEKEARRLGVQDRIELLGFVPREKVRDVLASSTLFILPSTKEALSRAVLEALSVGLPVVARKPNGVSDIVEHGREGYLADTLEDFADRIAELIRDPRRREKMAHNALRKPAHFGWDRVIPRHLEIYRLAIDKHFGHPLVRVVPQRLFA